VNQKIINDSIFRTIFAVHSDENKTLILRQNGPNEFVKLVETVQVDEKVAESLYTTTEPGNYE